MTRAQEIDAVMNTIDAACLARDYETAATAILATRDEPIAIGLAALTVSLPWHHRLALSRNVVIAAIREREPERHERLLSGLGGTP